MVSIFGQVCSVCKKEKSLENFRKNPVRKLGIQAECNECNSARARDYYFKKKEKIRKLEREKIAKAIKELENKLK